ncbi:hypothetical protein [Paractinoplanes lichenicola]|uniref:Uncharacterized protein n=1 Tax=Paractinoplanes lichenicola TaxID=2802976 RepID=A0ABS1VE49_9ACTN|nr:hypothetical protein [Actinoplanes lichenicola]MBL7252967.1 hypothetical protein [Actinoplanes lichenicola]
MRSTFHRTLSTVAVAGALVATTGVIGVAAAALNAKPLRAELVPGSSSSTVEAKPLRAEKAPHALFKPLRAE